jgi:anthranilate/para-aminobenzoate synthase component I
VLTTTQTELATVAGSVGEQEFLECLQKAKALAKALGVEEIESFVKES